MSSKIQTLQQAIRTNIKDGDSVVMGACLEPMIPFAAAREMIRQDKKELTLVAPISDILFDMMIGAGNVKGIIAAWAGNVSAGLKHYSADPSKKRFLIKSKLRIIATLP